MQSERRKGEVEEIGRIEQGRGEGPGRRRDNRWASEKNGKQREGAPDEGRELGEVREEGGGGKWWADENWRCGEKMGEMG